MSALSSFQSSLDSAAGTGGFATGSTAPNIAESIGYLIDIVLGMLGLALVILLVYAGFLYLTSQGNEEQIKKAKGTISNAVIGIVIVISAYALTNFILLNLIFGIFEDRGAVEAERARICADNPLDPVCSQNQTGPGAPLPDELPSA